MSYQMSAVEKTGLSSAGSDMPGLGVVTSYRLPRPGARPLVFAGTELAMAMSFTPELPYWYEINLYRTEEQHFVVAIRQFFQSESEQDVCRAWSFETLAEALDAIEHYDAARDIRMPVLDLGAMVPAELAARAMDLQSKVSAARLHFGGLAGELFSEIEAAGGSAV